MDGNTAVAEAITVEHVEVSTCKGIVVKPVQVPLLPEEAQNAAKVGDRQTF